MEIDKTNKTSIFLETFWVNASWEKSPLPSSSVSPAGFGLFGFIVETFQYENSCHVERVRLI